MSYRGLTMIDIKEMLRRRAAGHGARTVARNTGYDRKTVTRYFEAADLALLPKDREPTDEEVREVAQRVLPGKRATDPRDYPVGKDVVAMRDITSLIASAKKCGAHVGIYAERLLAVPLPWTRMRLVYALMRLCKKFGDGRVEAICQSALAFDIVDVRRIERMLSSRRRPR